MIRPKNIIDKMKISIVSISDLIVFSFFFLLIVGLDSNLFWIFESLSSGINNNSMFILFFCLIEGVAKNIEKAGFVEGCFYLYYGEF